MAGLLLLLASFVIISGIMYSMAKTAVKMVSIVSC